MKCWLDEAQAGIKIAGWNLRYADDTTLMAESEEELKILLMKVKEKSGKIGLKLNIQKTKIMASCRISSVQFSHSVMSDSLWPHEPQHAGLPLRHQLPEFTRTHLHWLSDAIRLSHPLLSPSPPAFNLSQHQGLFQWISSFTWDGQSIRLSPSATALPMTIQDWFL